ncbi:hypothetical protein Salat_1848300 [Sesamum alatum]|uniref:Uncharacterized protein n=1 Tax=Sesamum alatum TaxID=300844 RepID=A0AAE2CHS3_9LAMI|nr:hypothetical protein Salat_1848300 [Sesamum alatum]
MPRRTRASSSREPSSPNPTKVPLSALAAIYDISLIMSSKSIVKILNLLGLPEGYIVLSPVKYQWANNPHLNCLTVYAAQCVYGLRFPLHPFLVLLLTVFGIPPS